MGNKYIARPKVKEHHQAAPKITIHQMLMIAKKIDEETGHYPSYGELSSKIHYGHIKPADYLRGIADD